MRREVVGSHASAGGGSGRAVLRFTLAALAALMGVAYVLIALQVVHVDRTTTGGAMAYLTMAAAGVAFFLGAALVVLRDRRVVYLWGVAVQVVALVGYFAMASVRDPRYDAWGLTMKVVQAVMLALLLLLARTVPGASRRGRKAATTL